MRVPKQAHGSRGLNSSSCAYLNRLMPRSQEWIADTEALEEVQIMEEVPHALRREIAFAVNKKLFDRLALFHDFPVSEQQTIAAMMTPLQVGKYPLGDFATLLPDL